MTTLAQLIRRPELSYQDVITLSPPTEALSQSSHRTSRNPIEVRGIYSEIASASRENEKNGGEEISDWVDYREVPGISSEAREKLIQSNRCPLGKRLGSPASTHPIFPFCWFILNKMGSFPLHPDRRR